MEILETGLREALLRLNAAGGIQLPHSPASNPPSPTSSHYMEHSHDLTYNITQALKELQQMKTEREKGMYSEHSDHDGDHSDHDSRRDSGESTHAMSSAKTEDLATPLTSPSNSPPPTSKALFLPSEMIAQPQVSAYPESNLNFYQAYYDRQTSVPVLNLAAANAATAGPNFVYDESLSWLDSVALDESYDIALQSNDFSLMNL